MSDTDLRYIFVTPLLCLGIKRKKNSTQHRHNINTTNGVSNAFRELITNFFFNHISKKFSNYKNGYQKLYLRR